MLHIYRHIMVARSRLRQASRTPPERHGRRSAVAYRPARNWHPELLDRSGAHRTRLLLLQMTYRGRAFRDGHTSTARYRNNFV